DDQSKVRLTHEIVSNLMSGATLEIGSSTLDQARLAKPSLPSQRAVRLLRYLAKISTYLGAKIRFPSEYGIYPADVNKNLSVDTGFRTDELYAWSDSIKYAELAYLLEMLEADKLVKFEDGGSPPTLIVTPLGYSRIEKERVNPVNEQVFVAMWFDASMDKVFSEGFDPSIRMAGYRPIRIDQKEHLNKIDDEIVAEIKRSRFLVADFTSAPKSPRGGVYFEAGLALGLGMDVVWCCREDMINEVHFDTRQFNHIVWKTSQELKTKLHKRICATIGEGPLGTIG
ncbi:MAG: hypothetical protein ABJM34_05635, partial [Parasphingorhabdus sp.]